MARVSCTLFFVLLFIFSVTLFVCQVESLMCSDQLPTPIFGKCDPEECQQDCKVKWNGTAICIMYAEDAFNCICSWKCAQACRKSSCPICYTIHMLDAKFVVDGLRAGLSVKRVQNQGSKSLVSRQAICEGVKELMGGPKGRNARREADVLGRVARRAVQKRGSSHDTLIKLIDQFRVSM